MNGFASLPWFVRYSLAALIFTLAGISNPEIPWWGDVAIFVGFFLLFLAMQIGIDGWDHKKW